MPRLVTPILLLVVPTVFFVAFFLAPLCVIAIASFSNGSGGATLANYSRILADQYHWDVIWLTCKLSLITTAICVLLGYPLAYFLTHIVTSRTLRRICVICLVLPLFTSNIVRSFGWMVLLGRKGMVNDGLISLHLTDAPIRFLGTETGIVIGLVYIHLPFVVIAVGNALARLDRSLEHAAADLGARAPIRFLTITLPLSLPGLIAGSVMVFALSVSAYVTPALLGGGRITMFSMLIFQQYSAVFDFNYGGALSVTLLLLTLLMVGSASAIGRRGRAR